MKISILGTRGVPSGYSGYEAFAEELGSRLVLRGHSVSIYAHENLYKDMPAEYRGMHITYLPSLKGKNTAQFSHSFLASVHAAFSDADIILFCNAANGPFGLILKLAGKARAINVDGLEWLRPKWSSLARAYFKFGARCAGYFFDAVITDAKGMQDVYKRQFGITSDDIAYGANIRHSIDPSRIARYGLLVGEYYLIASRLVPDNNADLIIQAFVNSKSTKTLAIAGGASYKNDFEERCRRMADERVRFLGHIDDSETVAELHVNAFAYLHGHEFGGTNPALLKALACGNCILALDTVFNREVLKDGEFGLLFKKDSRELAEAIERLEFDNALAETFRIKSRVRIEEKYTWDKITDQYEALFKRIQHV